MQEHEDGHEFRLAGFAQLSPDMLVYGMVEGAGAEFSRRIEHYARHDIDVDATEHKQGTIMWITIGEMKMLAQYYWDHKDELPDEWCPLMSAFAEAVNDGVYLRNMGPAQNPESN